MSKKLVGISGFLFTIGALIIASANDMEEGVMKYGFLAFGFAIYCVTTYAVQQGIFGKLKISLKK